METCKTCRFWNITAPGEDGWMDEVVKPIDEDTYLPKEMPFEIRYCNSPMLMRFERPIMPRIASVIDGSMYKAKLATGPEFGCINHIP